jgi:hypothetical protein
MLRKASVLSVKEVPLDLAIFLPSRKIVVTLLHAMIDPCESHFAQ